MRSLAAKCYFWQNLREGAYCAEMNRVVEWTATHLPNLNGPKALVEFAATQNGEFDKHATNLKTIISQLRRYADGLDALIFTGATLGFHRTCDSCKELVFEGRYGTRVCLTCEALAVAQAG